MVVFPLYGFGYTPCVETSIELRYAGVVIGKVTVAGADPGADPGAIDENGLFLSVPDPLPVGTKVSLKIDERAVEGRVIGVAESTDPAKCGMRIRIGAATKVAATASASAPPPPPAPAAVPVAVAPAPSAPVETAPTEPAAPADAAVAAAVDAGADLSSVQSDGASDGGPSSEEGAGPSGGSGGGRRRRRRR